MNIFELYDKELNNKILVNDIIGKKIIACHITDLSLYWVYYLSNDNQFVSINPDFYLFYSQKNNVYFLYFTSEIDGVISNTIETLVKNNYLHFVIWKCRNFDRIINYFETNKLDNFDYSLINNMSEILFDDEPHKLNEYKNIKYFFTSTNVLKRNINHIHTDSDFHKNNENKIILDYKYSFTYFYTKLGFNYIQNGEHLQNVSNRLNKVFLYSKKRDGNRDTLINKAIETNKIYEKYYTSEDYFWYMSNYNYYHTPFLIDYNFCKFNLVMESISLSIEEENDSHPKLCKFFSEKTIKALLSPPPSYVALQKDVYEELKKYGFYFLNEEFGEYNYKNYEKFCSFLKDATDEHMEEMFIKTFEKSKLNKIKLEEYIYSNKTKELKLLLNE
jgi:hypothetical protein